ncbi:trypsin-like peptidase domain-containing protein [Antarctobacter sp.]|uniref:trypsin-like peptidase domain-containing protein n=1 Tax=Antarctobacter sp. TaxID=1872577 RepID=UPI003A954145
MPIARLAAAASILALTTTAHAQDLMLFPPETFGQVVAPQRESLLGDVQLEAQVGAYNNEFISNYGPNSVFARTGRAVGMVQILTNVGHAPCTGFLVEGNKLITNHHCVPGILKNPQMIEKGATSIAAVQFHAGFLRDGLDDGVKTFHVNPVPLETSEALDYTVLQVLGDANAEFGALELSAALPSDRDPFWVIGHPMGEAQRISREKCRADSPAIAKQRLRHTCDTLPGNSGSPVIDAGSQKVIALHNAGSRAGEVNFAVPMAEILAQSKVLTASAGGAADGDLSALQAEVARLRAERDAAGVAAKATADRLAKERADRDRLALEEADRFALEKAKADRVAALKAERDLRACYRLAGFKDHPDRATGSMRPVGVEFDEIDADRAIPACKTALESNATHPIMLAFLGRAYASGGQYKEAIEAYTRAGDLGDPLAQFNLGKMYQIGQGIAQSDKIAAEWFRKAADQGYAPALRNLGVMYQTGRGVAQSDKIAADWYRKAADQGDAVGQTVLGFMYENGRAGPTSPKEAAKLYIKGLQGGIDWVVTRNASDWSVATAMAMQQELTALGHYSGPIDGDMGPSSRAAMRALLSE